MSTHQRSRHRGRSWDYGTDPAIDAAARLHENLAGLMPAVRSHVWAEIALLDGARSKMPGAGEPTEGVRRARPLTGVCKAGVVPAGGTVDELVDCGRRRPCPEHDAPVELTSVESTVEARLRKQRALADLEQLAQSAAVIVRQALDEARRQLGDRVPVPDRPAQCRDGLHGRDGSVEWGDPLCAAPAEKSGLCSRHYMAWYRWRRANRLDTSGMFDPAAPPRPDRVTGSDLG